MRKLVEAVPLQFRILYRQFLLRVIDLEALSIDADIPRFLGQFASILVFISVIVALGLLMGYGSVATKPAALLRFTWTMEQGLISGTMLVVGLIAVITWDATFPDRKDVMVLSPLPVSASTVLLAKVSASIAMLGLATLALNFATGIACPLALAAQQRSHWGFFRSFSAYWFTMIAACVLIYCAVLTIQGVSALLLPRRLFLRLSAMLQLLAFGLVLGGYFLQPSITALAAMEAPANRSVLAWSPSFWLFALLNQLNGSLPPSLAWVAHRAWIALAVVLLTSSGSLFLCYLRTMKKIAEAPDLVAGTRSLKWAHNFRSSVRTAIVLFSIRSLARSRQHRLAFAFYAAVIASMASYWAHIEITSKGPLPINADLLIATYMMMALAVFGLRSVFALPISLKANWVLRLTQLRPSEHYMAATRSALLLMAVIPAWLVSALLMLSVAPWRQGAVHLLILALVGWLLAEVSLIGFYKVPFTCSYLPGKVHFQVIFACFLLLLYVFAMTVSDYELPSLNNPIRGLGMIVAAAALALGVSAFNRKRAKSATLYFEENSPEAITTLGVASIRTSTEKKEVGLRRS